MAAELARRYAAEAPRGEITLVIGAAAGEQAALGPALEAVDQLIDGGARPRAAAAAVAKLTGNGANRLYRESRSAGG